jgi:hypothetical protein
MHAEIGNLEADFQKSLVTEVSIYTSRQLKKYLPILSTNEPFDDNKLLAR